MNDDKFSLKARRSTRIPLRVPVVLINEEKDRTRSWDGWTMIVNTHGARIECRHPFGLEEEVLIQVPFNGKSQKGKIIWNSPEANKNGNFEYGVELDRPENLWDVKFPPCDWKPSRAEAAAELGDPPIKKEPGVVPPESNLLPAPDQSSVEITAQNQAAEPVSQPVVANEPTAPANLAPSGVGSSPPLSEGVPPIVNLTAELSEWETVMNEQPSSESPLDNGVLQQSAGPMGIGMNLPWADSRASGSEGSTLSRGPASPAPAGLELLHPGTWSAAPADLSLGSVGSMVGQTPATDRLSAIFNELVESALHARLLGLAERLGARMEARIAETEALTLAHMEQQILRTVSSQSERLEKHAVEIVANQQQLLEQNVQKFLQTVEASTMHRQQEFLENSRRVMRNEVTEVMKSSKAQLQQEISELAPMAWTSLRQSIDQELPSIEKQFVEQCRAETQRLLAGQMEELTRLCSQHIQEADQSVSQRLETMVEENTTRLTARFEAHSELLRAQSCGQLERQLEQIGNQARQALVRHIVTELDQKRKLWMQDAECEWKELMGQNLHQTRQGLSLILKELGECLIRQAYQEGGAPGEVSCACNGQEVAPAPELFDEAKFGSRMEATASPLCGGNSL